MHTFTHKILGGLLLCSSILFAGSVGDEVFLDANANGVKDGTEAGINGVLVSLESGGEIIATTNTSPFGTYTFSNLPGGLYRVSFAAPAGMSFSPTGIGLDNVADAAGNGPTFGLAANEDRTNIDAGLFVPATLSGSVFADLNGDGVQGADEVGFLGVPVQLTTPNGVVVASATTTGSGIYTFANVTPGMYFVRLMIPAGFEVSGGPFDAFGLSVGADLASGQSASAGAAALGWSGECPAIDEFQTPSTITLGGVGTSPLASTFTVDGNVIGGERDISLEILNPPVKVQPASAFTVPGEGDFEFGSFGGQYSLRGCITYDGIDSDGANLNASGLGGISLVAGDTPFVQNTAFRIVTLPDQGAMLTVEVYTDAGNMSSFSTALSANTQETTDIPFTSFTAALGAGADFNNVGAIVICAEDSNEADLDFELQLLQKLSPKAALGNRVWLDLNANGVQELGEEGIPGVTVNLYDNANPTVVADTTTTDAAGLYIFDCLIPGEYFVEFVCPPGYELTTQSVGDDSLDSDASPTTKRTTPTTLVAAETDLTWDAGLYLPAKLGNLVWLDSDRDGLQGIGPSGVSGVPVRLLDGLNPANVLATTNTDSNGGYQFCDLRPGKYIVDFDPPAGYIITTANAGNDTQDSDVNAAGQTPMTMLMSGDVDFTLDAGLFRMMPDYTIVKNLIAPVDGAGQVRAAEIGDTVTFQVLITNTGETVLNTVPLTDTWDSTFLSFSTASTTPNSASPGTLTWNDLGALAPGNVHSVVISYTALASTSAQQLLNKAATSPTTPTGIDPVPMRMDTAPYIIQAPAYTLVKDRIAPPGVMADVGDTITFTLTVNNTGEVPLITVPLDDTFDPLDLQFVSASPSSPIASTGRLQWPNIGSITPGNSRTITVNFLALRSTAGAVKLNTVCTTPSTPRTTLAEQCDTAPYQVVGSSYTMTKVRTNPVNLPDTLNGQVTFEIAISNTGETPLTTVPLSDTYDGSILSFSRSSPISPSSTSSGQLNWNHIGRIDPQGTRTISVTFDVIGSTGGAILTNVACTTPSTPSATLDQMCAEAPYQVVTPGIELIKTVHLGHNNGASCPTHQNIVDDLESGIGGTEVTYCFEIINRGDVHLTSLQLMDMELGLADINAFSYQSGSFPLPPGASQFYFTESIISSDLVNTAMVVGVPSSPVGDPLPSFGPLTDKDIAEVRLEAVSVGNFVWVDSDLDGTQDTGEPGLPGVVAKLKNSVGLELDTTTTDANGFYLFSNLPPGSYSVCFELPPECTPTLTNAAPVGSSSRGSQIGTTAAGGFLMQTPTTPVLLDGQSDLTLDQGVVKFACIGDTVWEDLDSSGDSSQENLGQLGLVGIRLVLYSVDNGLVSQVDETLTGANGYYKFDRLAPGCYEVEVDRSTVPALLTTLTTPAERLATCVAAGDFDQTLDFGFASAPTAVELSSFTATSIGGGDVTVDWQTGWEENNLGFLVFRSSTPDGARTQANEGLILPQGDNSTYGIRDVGLADGTYFYTLVAIDTDLSSEEYGPVAVTIGGGPTDGLLIVDTDSPASSDVLVNGTPVPSLEVDGGLLVYLADSSATVSTAASSSLPFRIAAVEQAGDTTDAPAGATILDVSNPAAPVVLIGGTAAAGAAIRIIE